MKASTLWQPYASLISIKAKPFETRAYPPPVSYIGKRIAIHAAVRKVCLSDFDRDTLRAIDHALTSNGCDPAEFTPRGVVVCTGILAAAYQCGPMDEDGKVFVTRWLPPGDDPIFIQSDPFGDYSPGRWAWLMTDVEPLAKPVPATGKQGWWTWEPERIAA